MIELGNLQRSIARFSDVIARFGWTPFRTTKGTTGAVNESGKKLYGAQAQRVLAGGRGGKGDDVVRGEKPTPKQPVPAPKPATPASPAAKPATKRSDMLPPGSKIKDALPPGGHEQIKAMLASSISKAPSEPKQLAKAADAAMAQHQQMRKANPLPPAVEQASKKLIAEKLPSFGEKIANAVKGTLKVSGKAAEWAVKNTARLVGGTILASGATLTHVAHGTLLANPATTLIGFAAGGAMTDLALELWKGSFKTFSKLGQFADDDLTGDTGTALPMDQVKQLAQQFAAELQAEWQQRMPKRGA